MRGLFGKKQDERRAVYTGDPDDYRLTLVEHIDELRSRLVRIVVFITVGWIIGWIVFADVYRILNSVVDASVRPVIPEGRVFTEVFHQTTEPFMLKLRLSFYFGMMLALPFIVGQLWGFIAPGLTPKEQRPLKLLVPWTVVLFFVGAGFAWLVLPNALQWFAGYLGEFPGVDLYQEAGTMVFFVIKMLIAFGIAFQLPLIVYLLGALNLLSAETLMKYWRHAVTIIFFAAALITPSNDPISMLMMAVPLVVLFMISAWLVKLTQRRKKREALAAEPEPAIAE